MKLLHVLPILLFLPVSAFADYGSYLLRPFIGYNISVARYNHSYTEYNGHYLAKSNDLTMNTETPGQFVFGLEFYDILEVSIMPSVNTFVYKDNGGTNETTKYNELDFGVDVFLTKNSKVKPYVSLELGYVDMNDSAKTSGAIFGLGFGCKKYFDNNFYIGANLGYALSTKMDVTKLNGTHVNDVSMQISGANLSLEAGYRF